MKLPIDNNDKVLRILLKKNHPSDKADISKQSYLKEKIFSL